MDLFSTRSVFQVLSRQPVLAFLLATLATVGSGSHIMAQPQAPAERTSPLPPWCLPPDVEATLNYRVDRLKQDLPVYTWVREYEKACELQRQIADVTEQLAGEKHYRTAVQRLALRELEQLCALSEADRLEYQQAMRWMTESRQMIREADYDRSLSCLDKADIIIVRLVKLDSASIIACGQLYTLAYWMKHETEKAKIWGTKTLEIIRRTNGEDSPDFLNQLGMLGGILEMANDLDQAEPILRRAVKDFERLGGRNNSGVAENLHRLAKVLYKQKKLAEAEAMWREAVTLSENKDMSVDRTTVYSLRGLADIYSEQRKYQDAEACIRRALELDERTFGKEHLEVVEDLDRYVKLLRTEGRSDEAGSMEARAKEARAHMEEKRLAAKRAAAAIGI